MRGLPADWSAHRLDEIADIRLGRQRSPKNHVGPQMRPYLRAANIGWAGLKLDDIKSMNFSDSEMGVYQLSPGDVLLNEASGSPGEVGKPALWSGELDECAFQNTLIRIRSHDVEPRYLLHYFRYVALIGGFSGHARGVGIHHLSRARIAGWSTPIPPPDEQRRIVDILEDHLSRLDAAERGIVFSVDRSASLKERVLAAGLLGETTPGPREPYDLPDCGTDDGQLPDLPMGWTWRRLGEITNVAGGITKDSKRQSDPAFVEVPYLRVANVQRGRLDLAKVTSIRVPASKAKALRLLAGDVLMNEGGDRDKLARGWVWEGQVEDCIHQNHVFRARIVDGAIEPKLLSWAANTIGGRWAERNGKQSVNLASISLTKIRQMPVPVPPMGVQPELVKQLEDQLQACDRLAVSLNEARARAATLRRSLLAAAFSGRLTGQVTDTEMVEEMARV